MWINVWVAGKIVRSLVNTALYHASSQKCSDTVRSLEMQELKIANRHLGTIAQLCLAMSSQLRHVSTIGKIGKQQHLSHMSLHYRELQLTSG